MGVIPFILNLFGFDRAQQSDFAASYFKLNRAKRLVTFSSVK
jgi:hypothetical protein